MWTPKKILNYVLAGLVILYTAILLFPQMLFSNKFDHSNFTVYYHAATIDSSQISSILDKSSALLSTSELYNPKKEQKIFLCNSFGEFTFFALRSRNAFAVNYPLAQNIFLSKSSILENTIIRNGPENNVRTMSGIIAHETMHSALEDELGLLKYKLLPTWKNEGYADYVAKESSFDEKLGFNQFCENNGKMDNPSYAYFKYKVYVKYLLDKENIEVGTLLKQDFDLDSLALFSKNAFCPEL